MSNVLNLLFCLWNLHLFITPRFMSKLTAIVALLAFPYLPPLSVLMDPKRMRRCITYAITLPSTSTTVNTGTKEKKAMRGGENMCTVNHASKPTLFWNIFGKNKNNGCMCLTRISHSGIATSLVILFFNIAVESLRMCLTLGFSPQEHNRKLFTTFT